MSIIRPSSDLLVSGWTPSSGSDAYATVDEPTASDADYISTSTPGAVARIALGTTADPGNNDNHKLTYRASSPEGDRGLIARVVEYGNVGIVTSKQPWRRQPQGAVEIDWVNPLAKALKVWQISSVNRPALSGVQANKIGLIHKPGSPNVVAGTFPANYPALSGMSTVSVGIIVSASGGNVRNTGIKVGTTGFVGETVDYVSNTQIKATVQYSDYTSSLVAPVAHGAGTSNSPLAIGTTYSRNNAEGLRLFANGRIVGVAATSNKNIFAAAQNINLICGSTVFLSACNFLWLRSLSDYEIKSMSANPWQIFKPKKRISYFDAPKLIATRTPTLTTTPADYTIDLSSGEAGLITDYGKLGVEFEAT